MALDEETTSKIKAFIYKRPRNINEIALLLGINWRTANRYVDLVAERTGLIETHIFKQGGRGSMKVAFWSNKEMVYSTQIQEKLFQEIERGIEKEDFSPLEIFQYVDKEKGNAYYEEAFPMYDFHVESLFALLKEAKEAVCVFSGNVAWIHFEYKGKRLIDYIKEEVLDKGIKFKIITNITLVDIDNVKELLALNFAYNTEMVEIRHDIVPMRCYLIDDKKAKFSEVQKVGKRPGMKQKDYAIYYEIWDKEWVAWLKQIFWKRYQNAVPSSKRIAAIDGIHFLTRE